MLLIEDNANKILLFLSRVELLPAASEQPCKTKEVFGGMKLI
jgi:hypothetical protein